MNNQIVNPDAMVHLPSGMKDLFLNTVLKHINESEVNTPEKDAATEIQHSKRFARLLKDSLDSMGVSYEQFADDSGIPVELIETLANGILPGSEIGDQILLDISRSTNVEIEVFQAALGRAPNVDFLSSGEATAQWALAYRYHIIAPDLKRAIARYFVTGYLGRILNSSIQNMFIESGSATAFVVEEIIDHLEINDNWLQRWKINIETNNYLAAGAFKEFGQLHFVQYPVGPVKRPFGATFGKNLLQLPVLSPPTYQRSLSDEEQQVVSEIKEHFVKQYHENGLIFMAASGLEVPLDSEFPGPHVGDYYNQLFKRAILESQCPTIIFLHDDKLTDGFKKNHCYSVGGWSSAVRDQKIAVAVGCGNQQKANELKVLLEKNGFPYTSATETPDGNWALFAMSKHFHQYWKSVMPKEGNISVLA
ncbi:MAG: hypothetical protein R3E39_08090 [Anaerolineae bacterium]